MECAKNIQRFITKNGKDIYEYDSITDLPPFEYCVDDIVFLYKNALKSNPTLDINYLLKIALQNAIVSNTSITECFEDLVIKKLYDNSGSYNVLQQYFKEVGQIYERNNNNFDIEYCPENRDKIIEMNLKTVISIAKKYQGLGLSMEELISAGNLGLVTSFDKFDPSRSQLKDNIISKIEELPEEFSKDDLYNVVNEYLTYGDIKSKFNNAFKKNIYTKNEVLKWVDKNIYNAKFNSVSSLWIRAYILIELDQYSRLVKKPKSEIHKDKEENGSYKKEITMALDQPVSNESSTPTSSLISIEDDTRTSLEVSEARTIFKDNLNKLLDGVKSRDRSVFLKKFGIGLPRPMLPKEIAEQEGLSIARISQIFQTVVSQMHKNQIKYNINSDLLFDVVKKIY